MILAVPVMDGHDVTAKLVKSLAKTVRGPFKLVIWDNGSAQPYRPEEFSDVPFPVQVYSAKANVGYYRPLQSLYASAGDEPLIGLVHNDMIFYEEGWDLRVQQAFDADPKLGLVGLCGSNELDENGGRGGGTMCFFRGEDGQQQSAGLRIHDLQPSVVLDSLFMMFRPQVIPVMESDWENLPLAHFYDKIWPCRLIEQGWRVATLGSEIDHWGSLTLIANERYEADCQRWCEAHGILPQSEPDGKPNWGLSVYLEAERRFLVEYRSQKKFMPCKVNANYEVSRG